MVGTRVTIRYARALFELAREKKLLSQVADDLNYVLQVYQSSADFSRLLDSPVVQTADKKKIFVRLFRNKVNPLTGEFLDMVVEKGRENLLAIIIERFHELLDREQGILRGRLETAYRFSQDQLAALKKQMDKLTGKNVIIRQHVNPELLGGFIIRLEDTVIDTCIKSQLARMREAMVSGE